MSGDSERSGSGGYRSSWNNCAGREKCIMDNYVDRLKSLSDDDLKREWSEESGERLRQIEHEMAMRFRNPSTPQQLHYLNKLLDMPKQFLDAYHKKDWARAKYIYDTAIRVALFLEIPVQLRSELFGISAENEKEIQGDFPRDIVSKVMEECIVKNSLGHECIVYRIPGEIGFYGAKHLPGVTRRMLVEENPSFWIQEAVPS